MEPHVLMTTASSAARRRAPARRFLPLPAAVLGVLLFLSAATFHSADTSLSSGPPRGEGESDRIAGLFWSGLSDDEVVSALIESMSDEEILGQIFLLGYSGRRPSRQIMEWIRQRNIGGVKIFGWNAEDTTLLTRSVREMQQAALSTRHGIPLLIATDQEGGWVRHVKGDTMETPGNLAIGATGLPWDAYRTGYFIGRELRAVGINMNFAPTVDTYVNPGLDVSGPRSYIVGPRAFSEDPVQTAVLALAYVKGMEEAGVVCTAKHFPGHGNADDDSHGELPLIDDDFPTLWNRDLVPYRMLVREGLPAIMSGHLGFPRITGTDLPATLSPFFAREVVRTRLGFEGILLTDDLYMNGALVPGKDIADIGLLALEAGHDMIMLSRTPELNDRIWLTVSRRFESDPLFRNRVIASVERILRIKVRYLRNAERRPRLPEPEVAENALPDREGRRFILEQAARSVTLLRPGRIPLVPDRGERILLAGQIPDFIEEGKRRFPGADSYYFPFSPFYAARTYDLQRLPRIATEYDTVVFCLANPNGLELLEQLRHLGRRVVVISSLTPVYLKELPWVETAIAVYGWGLESFQAGYAVLAGDYAAEGRLPLSLDLGGEPVK